MPPRYVIEQLDAEVFPWALLEFKHILTEVPPAALCFTNVTAEADVAKLQPLGSEVRPGSLRDSVEGFGRLCVLDPKAAQVLQPEDAELFDTMVFGGILGNHPMDGRTERELSSHLPAAQRRHLGDVQMTTDTAVLVTHRILQQQTPFSQLQFVDFPEIPMGGCEVTEMPFRYLVDKAGNPRLPEGMIDLWKQDVALDESDIQW
eukprot:EG_transcript_23003